jgi:hypothetical protein
MSEFNRENRYLVFKRKDIAKYLNQEDVCNLVHISNDIKDGRVEDGKEGLSCVVVESDWPIYEKVWSMVEESATNHKE